MGRRRREWAGVIAVTTPLLLLGLLLGACADGYPTEDAPRLDEYAMEAPELLQVLNTLGERSHLDAHYRYTLRPGCLLEVTANADEPTVVPLQGADIRARTGQDGRTYEVLLQSPQAPGSEPVRVLAGGQWMEWVQARSMLVHLQRHCTEQASLRNPSGSAPR